MAIPEELICPICSNLYLSTSAANIGCPECLGIDLGTIQDISAAESSASVHIEFLPTECYPRVTFSDGLAVPHVRRIVFGIDSCIVVAFADRDGRPYLGPSGHPVQISFPVRQISGEWHADLWFMRNSIRDTATAVTAATFGRYRTRAAE